MVKPNDDLHFWDKLK